MRRGYRLFYFEGYFHIDPVLIDLAVFYRGALFVDVDRTDGLTDLEAWSSAFLVASSQLLSELASISITFNTAIRIAI